MVSVPLGALIGHELALAGAIDAIYGAGAGTIVIFAAIFILLSHQNLQYMVASRVLYSLSTDGLGTRRAASVGRTGGAVLWDSWHPAQESTSPGIAVNQLRISARA